MIIDTPGLSVVAVDPGGTTGVAVYNGWTRELCWDQIDCGLGAGKHKTRDARSRKSAAAEAYDYVSAMEYAAAVAIVDMCIALGPHGTLVLEDFILGHGGDRGVGYSSKREGLSPVRMNARIQQEGEARGLFNGDAWRAWRRLDLGGMDARGVICGKGGAALVDSSVAERYALRLETKAGADVVGAAWSGGGWQLAMQMPSEKEMANDERMRRWGFWIPGKGHAVDALRHWVIYERKCQRIPVGKPERVTLVR